MQSLASSMDPTGRRLFGPSPDPLGVDASRREGGAGNGAGAQRITPPGWEAQPHPRPPAAAENKDQAEAAPSGVPANADIAAPVVPGAAANAPHPQAYQPSQQPSQPQPLQSLPQQPQSQPPQPQPQWQQHWWPQQQQSWQPLATQESIPMPPMVAQP